MSNDIFLITSVINTSTNPFTYTDVRSVYSTEERLEQTLKTIESIRSLNDNTKIMLIDCSILTEEQEDRIIKSVDYYIQLSKDNYIFNICHNSNKKGYGEIVTTKIAVDCILYNNIIFDRLFKISGRYYLTDKFNKTNYSSSLYTIKLNHSVLYSVPYNLLNNFNNICETMINVYQNVYEKSLESLVTDYLNPRVLIEDKLGIEGYVSVDGSYVNM